MIKVADLVEEVKTESSKWIKTKGLEFKNFHWQKGYGAFSIGQSNVAELKRYIRSQKQHHRRVTFQDEYRKFLKRYEIEYTDVKLGIDSHSALSALALLNGVITWAVGPGSYISRPWRSGNRAFSPELVKP